MTANQKRWAIRVGAGVLGVAVIVGVWKLLHASLIVIGGLVVIGFLVLVAFKVRANRKTKVIFSFYLTANEILVDGERSRYHFEIAEVIKSGERIVRSMPDAPPLTRFALGALYYSINDHNAAAEQLGFAAEEDLLKESRHIRPSRQLRRYVAKLRKIERRPKRSAKLKAAIASLEGMHQERAGRLLAESQQQLKRMVEAYEGEMSEQNGSQLNDLSISPGRSLKSITAPRPISEVLNDIYQEEPKAS